MLTSSRQEDECKPLPPVPAACNMDDLAAAMEIIDALDMSHTRRFMAGRCRLTLSKSVLKLGSACGVSA